ncbi:unnamed protein product, partial [Gongylonema pulchrum]|uniref:AB hydrolase-1 domain-containing protein n=1 Tax=Gongylonema pulchrum TaxID=637853 RepID=A0A183EI65_9BILA
MARIAPPAAMLWSYVTGPKVYAYFRERDTAFPSNSLEYVGDTMLTVINGCGSIAYNRSLLNGTNFMVFAKFTVTYYMVAMSTRTIGRLFNPDYRVFADTLMKAGSKRDDSVVAATHLREYDYQIFAAPVDFQARKEPRKFFKTPSRFTRDDSLLYTVFRDYLSYNIIFEFARGLIYPGSISFLNKLIESFLIEHRRRLVVEKGGRRAVVVTVDGNRVDAMFVDRRGSGTRGNILVVACEGNAGFYETGIMLTPLALNYSVLGWNQPAAVDAVMQYAIHELGFSENQIVIYAWSIGGFPATWAAANYPYIKALILDATFDDLLPLAKAKMPQSWAPLVEFIVRTYFDLPVALQV